METTPCSESLPKRRRRSATVSACSSCGSTGIGGVVFELSPAGEKVLHNFGVQSIDGLAPAAGLVFDHAGNLFGTTAAGGVNYGGTVFKLAP